MNAILRVVRSLGAPWWLVGDVSATPQETLKSGWLKALDGNAVTPGGAQISGTPGKGRMIDYAIVPN
eukprot:8556871-Pyramimonas_sp.AAC.1